MPSDQHSDNQSNQQFDKQSDQQPDQQYDQQSVGQGWGQVQLTKYSSTPSTSNIYQVQVLVKYSFFYKST